MFNFKTLKLTKRCDSESTNSFVGIRRNENGEVEFRLPHGFDDFPENDFNATKDLFFKMYRTFKKFERDNWRSNILDSRSAGKDNVETEKNGYRFKDKEENDVVLYSKIALIENLLEVYRDLSLDVIERRIGREEKIDYSKIDRYLDKAIYLSNDVIYIDEMDLPRQTLRYEATTLIDLFCFIVSELQNELEQDIEPRVQELAYRFSEQHLSHEESLFNEETFETTIHTLKGVLDDIDKRTAYKDEDYWRLYEAIETFLYGELDMEKTDENGIYWGIDNFWSVWEDMCSTYAFNNFDVLYADTNIMFNGKRVKSGSQKKDFKNPFFIKFRDEKKRWMRPDLIHFVSPNLGESENLFSEVIEIVCHDNYGGLSVDFEVKLHDKSQTSLYELFLYNLRKTKCGGGMRPLPNGKSFKSYPKVELEKQKKIIQNIHTEKLKEFPHIISLLDWKYMDENCFIKLNDKVKKDVTKQLCYEFVIQKVKKLNEFVESQFVIPWFYTELQMKIVEDDIGDFMNEDFLFVSIRENKIKIFKANFSKIQQIYLTHD